MAQKVAVPAVTLRKHAKEAFAGSDELRSKGLVHSARATDRAIEEVLGIEMPDNPGELVSIDASAAGTLAADGIGDESWDYTPGLRSMLEHQNFW